MPVTAADQFHLGSDTKAMTAGLLGLLVDDGRVAGTTTLREVWPELAPAMRPEYRDVTVADLLGQHSGLPRDPGVPFTDSAEAAQRISLVRWAVAQPPTGARGTYAYSNVNYAVAGAIAERVTGRPYAVLMTERIFRPLGIRSAGWGPPARRAAARGRRTSRGSTGSPPTVSARRSRRPRRRIIRRSWHPRVAFTCPSGTGQPGGALCSVRRQDVRPFGTPPRPPPSRRRRRRSRRPNATGVAGSARRARGLAPQGAS